MQCRQADANAAPLHGQFYPRPLELLSSDTAGSLVRSTRGYKKFPALLYRAKGYLAAIPNVPRMMQTPPTANSFDYGHLQSHVAKNQPETPHDTHQLRPRAGPQPQLPDAHDSFIDRRLALGAWELVDAEPGEKNRPSHGILHVQVRNQVQSDKCFRTMHSAGDLMQAREYFEDTRTAALSLSHTACRVLYARAAVTELQIRAADVLGAYSRTPPDT
eukprot:IDg11848t1